MNTNSPFTDVPECIGAGAADSQAMRGAIFQVVGKSTSSRKESGDTYGWEMSCGEDPQSRLNGYARLGMKECALALDSTPNNRRRTLPPPLSRPCPG